MKTTIIIKIITLSFLLFGCKNDIVSPTKSVLLKKVYSDRGNYTEYEYSNGLLSKMKLFASADDYWEGKYNYNEEGNILKTLKSFHHFQIDEKIVTDYYYNDKNQLSKTQESDFDTGVIRDYYFTFLYDNDNLNVLNYHYRDSNILNYVQYFYQNDIQTSCNVFRAENSILYRNEYRFDSKKNPFPNKEWDKYGYYPEYLNQHNVIYFNSKSYNEEIVIENSYEYNNESYPIKRVEIFTRTLEGHIVSKDTSNYYYEYY